MRKKCASGICPYYSAKMSPIDPQLLDRINASARFSLSTKQKRALLLIAAAAVAFSVALLMAAQARPSADVIESVPLRSESALASGNEISANTSALVVDVQGEVVNPGLYELPLGSRVGDAIKAAGGIRKGRDSSSVNLARFLEDGEQVFVSESGNSESGVSGATRTSRGKLNLNRASENELDGLPGVGPVLAKRIVAYRDEHGTFSSVDELQKVSGIGPAKFGELRSFITV